MVVAAIVLSVLGIVIGVGLMIVNFRKKKSAAYFADIDGVLKQDWSRTGNIDFHITEFDSASPQYLVLRVEEQKVTENAMGQDVVQLRWRLATVEEAKDIVVYWNAGKAERTPNPDRRNFVLKSA
jgi:hypothetical protein